jgi:glycerol-3-phosphate acyltransferase PlsX
MTVVALDAMGGDDAPRAMVQGALLAARDASLEIALVGRVGEVRALMPIVPRNVHLIDAPDAVGMADSPTLSLRQKPRSSILVGLELMQSGDADAFLSFGNTGAVMTASVTRLGRIPGVSRPAIGTVFRNARGSTSLILDVGANVDCRPEYLVEFATMGKAYFERVLHHRNPSVGLINIGQEPSKGNRFTKEAFRLLTRDEPNFVGNVEGDAIITGAVDIIVADGFVGNVVLKVSEGILSHFVTRLEAQIRSKPHYALAGWILKGAFSALKGEVDHRAIGGAPLFGVDGTVLIGHGRADAETVKSGIQMARRVGDSDFVEQIRTALAVAAVARSQDAESSQDADETVLDDDSFTDRPTPSSARGESG